METSELIPFSEETQIAMEQIASTHKNTLRWMLFNI